MSEQEAGQSVVPAPPPSAALVRAREILRAYPELVSFDPALPDNELLLLTCKLNPGTPAPDKPGWTGHVRQWWVGTRLYPRVDKRGEIIGEDEVLSLVLIESADNSIVLTGEPAIRSFWRLLREWGVERAGEEGVPVRVCRVPTSKGRTCWQVLPNALGR